MTGQKQCCANCYFFQDSGLSGQGHCSHPRRIEPGNGPGRLVRRQELACRNGWGEHLFTDPASVKSRESDDLLVARSTPAPAQTRLPEPSVGPEDRLIARDRTPNTAAHIDQDDRAKVMHQGARTAIVRARERHLQRQSGPTRSSEGMSPPPDQVNIESSAAESDTSPFDTASAAQSGIVPSVPPAEVDARRRNDSSIWDEVPTISADVELPLLRESLRLPGQAATTTQPSAETQQPSRYDLALQKAQEYRLAKARPTSDADDRVTSTAPVREHAVPPKALPIDFDDPVDEIVRYQPQRGTDLGGADSDTGPIETDDAFLDEDYELDRSWRNEAPSRQSGHRWWKAFGRSRVFGNDRRDDDRIVEDQQHLYGDAERPDHAPRADAPVPPHVPPPPPVRDMTITWDDRGLAPRQPAAHEFASLTYLDDEPTAAATMHPPSFAESRAVESPFRTSQRTPGPVGERIPGTDRTLHNWTYRDTRPEPARIHSDASPVAMSSSAPAPDDPVESEAAHPLEQDPVPDIDPNVRPAFDIRRIIARNAEPLLDMTIEIAPDIPRECGTCRHFRASGKSDRGWCTNAWAFPHRPLVNADAVHCTSSIGCWWLPTDEDWDPEEYVEWLHQSTPRADRIIAALYGEEPERQYGN